jgi:Uma2 family endonuclease
MATVTKPNSALARGEPNAHVFSLDGVSWEAYCTLRDSLDANHRTGIRLTYDAGRLDIVAPMYAHGWPRMILHAAVVVLTQEYGVPRRSLGSTTFRKAAEEKGFEPDQCYFLRTESIAPFRKRPPRDLDASGVPPPDLTIEVGVTSSSIDRMPLHAAWGVSEVWRVDEAADSVTVLLLDGRTYRLGTSRLFPGLTGELLGEALTLESDDEDEWMEAFRSLVRERLRPGDRTSAGGNA